MNERKGASFLKIQILHLLSGAEQARGLTVIIDVFRAFSVEAYFFARGGEKILAVADSAQAYEIKRQHPEYLLVGERHGVILPGFDCGNSPSELVKLELSGKTMVHTTSSGTQGIERARGASQILGGSLVTAKATAEYIKHSSAEEVSLVCMGWEGQRKTEEDELCANYIKSLIVGTSFDIEKDIEDLKRTEGAKFFNAAQKDVFPRDDFFLCTDYDKADFVIRRKESVGGFHIMEKISI